MKRTIKYIRSSICTLLFLCVCVANAQTTHYQSGETAHYFCKKGLFQFGTLGSDCWGYRAPDGTEYAVYGASNAVIVINTATMGVVASIPAANSGCSGGYWRDMKTYGNYLYQTSECSGSGAGLMVMDMSMLPDSVHYIGSFPVDGSSAVTCHNMSIDTSKGFAYLEGTNAADHSIHIHDLANPAAPVYVSSFGIGGALGGIHDIYADDDTVFVAEGYNQSLSIWDLSNKLSPVLLKRWNIFTSGYVHNIWPREDRKYCATTTETADRVINIWNIEDLDNIQLAGQILGPSNLAHNAHWKGDKLYVSHYESGMIEVDVSDPTNPFIDLTYDTWPSENPEFEGCWGAYPFTNNGLVYVSNLDGRFFIIAEHQYDLHDTLWIEPTEAAKGETVEVTINASNSHPVHAFEFPITWNGPAGFTLVGTDRTGTRTDYFESEVQLNYDSVAGRMAVRLTSSSDTTGAFDLPAGSGPILKLILAVPSNAPTGESSISLLPYVSGDTLAPTFLVDCIDITPDTASASVSVVCCSGMRGDANGDAATNVVDLNYLVAYFFLGGSPPGCLEEADVNGNETINVVDLNYLVAYFFLGGTAPLACP